MYAHKITWTVSPLPQIQSVVESLKNKVVSCATLELQRNKRDENKVRKPIEEWTHLASSLAGSLEEAISSAFCQVQQDTNIVLTKCSVVMEWDCMLVSNQYGEFDTECPTTGLADSLVLSLAQPCTPPSIIPLDPVFLRCWLCRRPNLAL